MDWIEWVFSGVGVAVGAAILSWAWQRYRKEQNGTPAGVRISGSTSRSGGAKAVDETGSGAVIEDTDVEGELSATSTYIRQDPDPKV